MRSFLTKNAREIKSEPYFYFLFVHVSSNCDNFSKGFVLEKLVFLIYVCFRGPEKI